jgi:hypothetical protein
MFINRVCLSLSKGYLQLHRWLIPVCAHIRFGKYGRIWITRITFQKMSICLIFWYQDSQGNGHFQARSIWRMTGVWKVTPDCLSDTVCTKWSYQGWISSKNESNNRTWLRCMAAVTLCTHEMTIKWKLYYKGQADLQEGARPNQITARLLDLLKRISEWSLSLCAYTKTTLQPN